LTIFISLKDYNNYCYDSDVAEEIIVKVDGPYEYPDSTSTKSGANVLPVDKTLKATRKIQDGMVYTDDCSQYY
jgi:hypothetical protein